MEELLRRREAGDRTRMLVLTGVLAACLFRGLAHTDWMRGLPGRQGT